MSIGLTYQHNMEASGKLMIKGPSAGIPFIVKLKCFV